MRLLRLLLPLALLSACEAGTLPVLPSLGGLVGPREVAVLGDALIVRAPQGYCVDKKSARGGEDTAALLIGRCTPGGQVKAALVTVSVGRAGSAGVMTAGVEALRDFMASDQGRGMLSRSGKAEDLEVLESGVVEGRLLLHLRDHEAGEYWRAVIGLRGRLVTISALGAEDAPLAPEQGRKLVDRTVDALIRANPPATAPEADIPQTEAPAAAALGVES
jgi:hypothetical protein